MEYPWRTLPQIEADLDWLKDSVKLIRNRMAWLEQHMDDIQRLVEFFEGLSRIGSNASSKKD